MKKLPFPVFKIRQFLEPGPIVLIGSQWRGQDNLMTLGWHTVLEFSPSLVGLMISSGNHSFEMIRQSRECTINVPTLPLLDTTVQIGNCSGRQVDKFAAFGLTRVAGEKVRAPLVGECHANLECRLYESSLISKLNFFVFEVVAAQAAPKPKYPETFHYYGEGRFMLSGSTRDRRKLFRPDMLV